MILPFSRIALITTAATAAVAVPLNINAVVNDRDFRSLGAFATDLVVGAGAAAVAGVAGLAAIAPAARPIARVVGGIGVGALAGAVLGAGALVATERITNP